MAPAVLSVVCRVSAGWSTLVGHVNAAPRPSRLSFLLWRRRQIRSAFGAEFPCRLWFRSPCGGSEERWPAALGAFALGHAAFDRRFTLDRWRAFDGAGERRIAWFRRVRAWVARRIGSPEYGRQRDAGCRWRGRPPWSE